MSVKPDAVDLLTDEAVASLRQGCQARLGQHTNAPRQQMVVELALYTGAKANELTRLTCGDVRLVPGDETIRIPSPSNPRVLPLTRAMVGLLADYMEWKRSGGEPTDAAAPLVCSQRGGGLTLRGWQDSWALAQRHAGLLDSAGRPRYCLDSARAHAGMRVYRLRGNPHDAQAWLGLDLHTNVARYRPPELDFQPIDLRPYLGDKAVTTAATYPTNAHPALVRAVGLYNGTGGRVDRHAARRQFLDVPSDDPLGRFWIARLLDHGRSYFPHNPELARERAAAVIGKVRRAAESGDAMGIFLLASALEDGLGLPQDEAESLRLYKLAAAKGFETAFNNAGLMLESGRGTRRDPEAALEYFRAGAALHEASCMFNLAVMLSSGIGCTPDFTEALGWYHRAAGLGDVRSMNNLSYYYYHGIGVDRDEAMAERLYCLAGQLPRSKGGYGYVEPRPEAVLITLTG